MRTLILSVLFTVVAASAVYLCVAGMPSVSSPCCTWRCPCGCVQGDRCSCPIAAMPGE